MTMRAILFPHPMLTAVLALVWVLISNSISVANMLTGIAVGLAIAKLTSRYWPERPRLKHPLLIVEYIAIVLYDIVVSNLQVAYLVFFRPANSLQSRFVIVPVALRSPEAIAALAGTITMTPGTLSAEISPDRTSLRVHCLDTADGKQVVAAVKQRYERRLKRIFE